MKSLALAALLTLTTLPAAAQVSYPLVCRGGGAMLASVAANGGLSLQFAAGTMGIGLGTSTPTPGECRWLDRAFRAGEPTRLALPSGNPGNAQYLIDAMLRGETFYAHVYNDGAGNMRITRVGP